jgi:hypothetical protein
MFESRSDPKNDPLVGGDYLRENVPKNDPLVGGDYLRENAMVERILW